MVYQQTAKGPGTGQTKSSLGFPSGRDAVAGHRLCQRTTLEDKRSEKGKITFFMSVFVVIHRPVMYGVSFALPLPYD